MPTKSRKDQGQPPWLAYAPHVLSLAALLFGVYQFSIYQDVDRRVRDLTATNLELDARVKNQTADNLQLDARLKSSDVADKEFKQRVLFENRYLHASGRAAMTLVDHTVPTSGFTASLLSTRVLNDLDSFLKDDGAPGVSFSEPVVVDEMQSRAIKHGVVVLRVHNASQILAREVKLDVKYHDFPNTSIAELASTGAVVELLKSRGNMFKHLWEIRDAYQDWQDDRISLADIAPDSERIVPLSHVLGTNYYFGRVIMPVRLQWTNPVLQKPEEVLVAKRSVDSPI